MRSDNKEYYSEEDFEKEFGGALKEDFEEGNVGRAEKKKNKTETRNKEDKKRHKKNSKKKTAIIVIVCILAIAAAVGALAYNFLMNKLDNMDQRSLKGVDLDIDPQVAKDLKDYKNILLVGIDAREGEDPEACRSDAMIIISIHKPTKEVKLISVYRDSYLDIEEKTTGGEEEGYSTENYDNGYGSEVSLENPLDKATHSHIYGGPVNTIRMLNRNLDLNIESYIRVNWKTVADVVDDMGGLTLEVEDHELYEINKYINETNANTGGDSPLLTQTGKQTLDGAQAVTYCRIRGTDGDEARTERMRKTIAAAFDKSKTLKISQLDSIANNALPQITTSMTSSDIMKMVLGLNGYEMSGSLGWPYDKEYVTLYGVSYTAPVTLESNVSQLHEEAFKQKDYSPTERVVDISQRIIYATGLTETFD